VYEQVQAKLTEPVSNFFEVREEYNCAEFRKEVLGVLQWRVVPLYLVLRTPYCSTSTLYVLLLYYWYTRTTTILEKKSTAWSTL
jgi:hypothetical protein